MLIIFTYICDIAVKSGSNVHFAHGDKQIAAILNIAEISRPKLQIIDLGHFDGLVADRFRDLLINLQEAPEAGICSHIRSIDDLLQISVQLSSSAIDLLISLQLEVSLCW